MNNFWSIAIAIFAIWLLYPETVFYPAFNYVRDNTLALVTSYTAATSNSAPSDPPTLYSSSTYSSASAT